MSALATHARHEHILTVSALFLISLSTGRQAYVTSDSVNLSSLAPDCFLVPVVIATPLLPCRPRDHACPGVAEPHSAMAAGK